jgi:HlyD family secretion protein
MKRALKILLILAVIVAISVVGYMQFAAARPPQSPDYQVMPVQRDTIVSRIGATGSIMPAQQTNLTFKSNGRVTEIFVEPGQSVAQGDVLARLESRELALALERARVALEISEIQLAEVEAGPSAGEVAAARAAVTSAKANYERVAAGASVEDLATAEASLASARSALARLQEGPTEQSITVARANLEQARISMEQAQAAYDKVSWVGGAGALPQSLQLQQATINYEAAMANYELATEGPTESQLKSAQAQVVQAEGALQRLLNSPTESDLAVTESQVVQAQSTLDRLLDTPSGNQLAIAQQQVRQSEIAVEQAELAYEGAQLLAPFDGIVAQVNLELNELAPVGLPAVVLVDLSGFYVDVSVDELDVIFVEAGQEVILTLDAIEDQRIDGHVERVAPIATVVNGVASYVLRVTIDDEYPQLRGGMTANVDVITERHENAMIIPNRAINVDRQTGRTYVEKLVNQAPVETDVEVGIRGDQVTEILAGLTDGDEVIIRGVSSLERLQQVMMSGGGGF